MKMNTQRLYESIMNDVNKSVKNVLNESKNISNIEYELTDAFSSLIGTKIKLGFDANFISEHIDPMFSFGHGTLVKDSYKMAFAMYAEKYIIDYLNNYKINLKSINGINSIINNSKYDKWDYEDPYSDFKAVIKVYPYDLVDFMYLSYKQYKKIDKNGFFIIINISLTNNYDIIIEDVKVRQKKSMGINSSGQIGVIDYHN